MAGGRGSDWLKVPRRVRDRPALKHRRLPPDPMLWSLHVLDCLIK